MKSYWIALYTEIKNMDNYKKYSKIAIPIIKKYGGIPLVRGGKSKFYSGEKFLRVFNLDLILGFPYLIAKSTIILSLPILLLSF